MWLTHSLSIPAMDAQQTLIKTSRICQHDTDVGGDDVTEGGSEQQATGAHTGMPYVFISYASHRLNRAVNRG
jgi:hypothetical protein